jgi:hypothetical protein
VTFPTLGTGDGGPKQPACQWTAQERQNLVVILGVIVIVLVLIAALLIVRQPDLRNSLVILISAGVGGLIGILKGGSSAAQHNTQGVETANVEQVTVQPQGGQP